MGWYSPLTVGVKIIIQELWLRKVNWDDVIPSDLLEKWREYAYALENAKMSLPRSYLGSSSAIQNLNVFVDSSKRAYGANAYSTQGDQSAFLLSKCKVAPLKIFGREKPTIPLLELMSAVLGVELATTILRVFNANGIKVDVHFWCDNQAVLYLIHQQGPNKCNVVDNKTKKIEIFNELHNAQWHYVPTDSNPADLLTRGISLEQFQSSSLWKHGPSWLPNCNEWPVCDVSQNQNKSLAVHFLQEVPVAKPVIEQPETNIAVVIDPLRHKWSSLVRVTAIVQRVCHNFLAKKKNLPKIEGNLFAADLLRAELTWIRSDQAKFLATELKYLREKTGVRPPLVSQLNLFLDNDAIVRCNGRLRLSHLSQDTKHPIFIPKQSPLPLLIIQCYHERTFHSGPGNTVNSLRQRFWITCAVQTTKLCLRDCTCCRRENRPSNEIPDHASLPEFRVTPAFPFTATGIDYTASYIVRTENGDIKVYICLFTCAASRALQLELVIDLSAKEFIQAFRRFAAHHSLPALVMTHNATNFTSGKKIVQQLLTSKTVQALLSNQKIQWKFIPAGTPWYGGFWERLVALVKSSLRKAFGRSKPTFEEMRTIVAEVEAILNDRPLTKVSSSVGDLDALTPSHLMYGRRLTTLPYGLNPEIIDDPTYEPSPTRLREANNRQAKILANFNKIFRHDYLTALREHHQATRGRQDQLINVGDFLLVNDDGPRRHWPMAVVEKLIVSKDGKVRAADIRTANSKTNRPIAKLSPIEVTEPFIEPQSERSVPTDDNTAVADPIVDHHAAAQRDPNSQDITIPRPPRRQAMLPKTTFHES